MESAQGLLQTLDTFSSVCFFSKLTLNSKDVQVPFTKESQKNVVGLKMISFTYIVPHNNYKNVLTHQIV